MAAADTADRGPNATSLDQDANEPVLALLAEISANLKDLQSHSARFMSLANPSQHPISDTERRVAQRSSHRRSRRNTHIRSRRRLRRSVESSLEYSTTYNDSNHGIVENDEEIIVAEAESRSEMNICDREGSTGRDNLPVAVEGYSSLGWFSTSSQDRPISRCSDDAILEAVKQKVEDTGSQDSVMSTASSISTENSRSKRYYTMEVKYGDFPEPEICQQMFGDLPGRHSDECSSWLKGKCLIFSRDERCGFTFDNVSLAKEQDLAGVQYQIGKIEAFARDLRKKGGFFFFRESSTERRSNVNKIYNGTHVFRCEDLTEEALPRLSANGKDFSEEIPEIRPLREMGDDASLRVIWNKRKEMTRECEIMNSVAYGENHVDPAVIYHYKGEPVCVLRETGSGWVTMHQDGTESPERAVCRKYKGAHLTAPWRRLCVLTGLSRISDLAKDNIRQKVPLFSEYGINEQVSFSLDYIGSDVDMNGFADIKFFEESVSEHLDCKQLSLRKIQYTSIVKFQFSWYEIIRYGMSEKKQYSGRLYRDNLNRSLQLQSLMAIGTWQYMDELFSDDCDYWTLVIMAPAFFYHQEGDDRVAIDLHNLIAPLESILLTLSRTLFMIISRILTHWREIGDYVEQFIAAQDTFLHEDQHDRLLFDDDNFTRSRQYFWVITSIGEFIPVIDETLRHFHEVSEWVCTTPANKEKYTIMRGDLVAIKGNFERQRNRAATLRDGLFNASAVVESRLSTRLAQMKLLTYVSIFCLPLAFCAAFWAIPSITDPSTRTPFIVGTILISLATYLTVFNLDALVSLGSTMYSGFRTKRINQMAKDSGHGKWQERAQSFSRFEPDRGRTKPSEHWLLHPFGGPHKVKEIDADEEQYAYTRPEPSSSGAASAGVAEMSRGKAWKPWQRTLFKKSKNSTDRNGPSTA